MELKASHFAWTLFYTAALVYLTLLVSWCLGGARPSAPPTEQQAADQCIKSMIAWVERIGPVGRDWNQSQRREALGWFLYRVAELGNADATFHGQRDFACEALETYFPEIECWACEN